MDDDEAAELTEVQIQMTSAAAAAADDKMDDMDYSKDNLHNDDNGGTVVGTQRRQL